MRRSLVLALVGAVFLVVSGLAVVGLRVQQVHLAYQLDALRAERARSQALIRQFEVQVATLKSPARVAARARELGLTVPAPQQVLLAREFVAGTTGLAAAERNRVAAVGAASSVNAAVRAPLTP